MDIEDHLVNLTGEHSVLGRAIVVHQGNLALIYKADMLLDDNNVAGEDDLGLGGEEDSLTTGHAGARAGCCVITESQNSGGDPLLSSYTIILILVILIV